MGGLWIVLDYDQPGLSPPVARGSRRWLPQHTWLDGTTLIVERDAVRQCDLATASDVTLKAGRFDGFNAPRDWTLRTSPEGWRWSSGPG